MSNIAIVGSTGAVGRTIIELLEQRNFNFKKIKFLASKKSKNKEIKFKGKSYKVEELTKSSFLNIDYALFSAGAKISQKYIPYALKAGTIVIDNSSFFRNNIDVPLVIPEVNKSDIFKHKGIISNPNCTTIILLLALKPLADIYKLKNVYISTYQSVSGAGELGMQELLNQLKDFSNDQQIFNHKIFTKQIINNLIPQIGNFTNNSYTEEELKILHESRKILNLPQLNISATCVRVPVLTAHSESVIVEFSESIDIEKIKNTFKKSPGIDYVNNELEEIYPTPLAASKLNNCQIGRVRKVIGKNNAINFWLCGDQLKKGAALNAIQILEILNDNK